TWLNELAYKLIVRFPFIGLPNIIAGEEIIRECMQKAADPEPLSGEVGRFIEDRAYYDATCASLGRLKEVLGGRKPSREVARLIVEHLESAGR
ncbi:MAG: lipid-A-disaccharide synthase, partial [Chitinivibrionales bacterium]|nr:lipid-A-disaccharide synthase [Chitinivibrionales bacterium]MBD3396922.1 lipid-A-disaccharide synthase [Chitinivibrionales bacterium]